MGELQSFKDGRGGWTIFLPHAPFHKLLKPLPSSIRNKTLMVNNQNQFPVILLPYHFMVNNPNQAYAVAFNLLHQKLKECAISSHLTLLLFLWLGRNQKG